MKLGIIAALLLLSTSAHAQDKFTLTLDGNAVNVIGVALGQRPYNEVVGVVNDINAQIAQHQRSKVEKDIESKNAKPEPAK